MSKNKYSHGDKDKTKSEIYSTNTTTLIRGQINTKILDKMKKFTNTTNSLKDKKE